MPFTEYKIDAQQTAARMANILQSKGDMALAVAVKSVIKRMHLHGSRRYTDYGPYWYALKAVLRNNGYDYGDATDDEIAREYGGKTELETIIMADLFRDLNLAINPVGTRQFTLNGYSGELWTLFDSDMESLG
jgi:hypothetical protein